MAGKKTIEAPLIRDRIKELRRVPASELLVNVKNWRKHPERQKDAVRGILDEIGYADALLARENAGGRLVLIDGHLRKDVTPEAVVPVLVVDLSEAEADLLLASLDPLAAMAEADNDKLDVLLREVQTGSGPLAQMLTELQEGHRQLEVPEFVAPPRSVEENINDMEHIKRQRKEAKDKVIEKNDTEKYLVIVFASRADKEKKLAQLGLPGDERYLAASSLTIRAADNRGAKAIGAGKVAPGQKAGATG